MYGDDEVQVLGGCSGSAARLRAELRGELASGRPEVWTTPA